MIWLELMMLKNKNLKANVSKQSKMIRGTVKATLVANKLVVFTNELVDKNTLI